MLLVHTQFSRYSSYVSFFWNDYHGVCVQLAIARPHIAWHVIPWTWAHFVWNLIRKKMRNNFNRCVDIASWDCGYAPLRQRQLFGIMPFNLYLTMFIYTTKHVYMDARTRQLVPRLQTFIFMSVDYDDDVDDAVHADNGNSHEHTSYIAPNIKSDINDSSFEKL